MVDSTPNSTPKTRKPRAARRTPATLEEEVQVLIRLTRSQVNQLDRIAKREDLSRTKAAQKAVEIALQSDAKLVPQDDLMEAIQKSIGALFASDDFRKLINNSVNGAVAHRLFELKKEIQKTNNSIGYIANMISKL